MLELSKKSKSCLNWTATLFKKESLIKRSLISSRKQSNIFWLMEDFLEEVLHSKRPRKGKKEKEKCERWWSKKKRRKGWNKSKRKLWKVLNLAKRIILRQTQRLNRALQLSQNKATNLHLNLKNQWIFCKTQCKNPHKKYKNPHKNHQSPNKNKTSSHNFLASEAVHQSPKSKRKKSQNKKSHPHRHPPENPYSHPTHNSPNPKIWT